LNELLEINTSVWQMGGNILLNVAPEYNGIIPAGQVSRMDSLGKFNAKFAEAIYGTENGIPLELWPMNSTTKPGVLYLFVNGNPARELVLKGCISDIAEITNLADGKKLSFRMSSYFKMWGKNGWIYITPLTVGKTEAQTVLKVTFKDSKAEFQGPNGAIKW
jgi:alpha-L-fucosidase